MADNIIMDVFHKTISDEPASVRIGVGEKLTFFFFFGTRYDMMGLQLRSLEWNCWQTS